MEQKALPQTKQFCVRFDFKHPEKILLLYPCTVTKLGNKRKLFRHLLI